MKMTKNRFFIISNVIFIANILMLAYFLYLFIMSFTLNSHFYSIIYKCLSCFGFIIYIKNLGTTYELFLMANRKSKRLCPPLSNEELEMIEYAKELIKSVDKNIVIADFNVYKIRFYQEAWFCYDEYTQELMIFIPFKYILKSYDNNLCFTILLHEILHSQNQKNDIDVFTSDFSEGITDFFCHWLINNYSKKYELSKTDDYNSYEEEENMVKDILEKSNIDLKQVFLKFIDFDPEFFKSFVPSEYFEE